MLGKIFLIPVRFQMESAEGGIFGVLLESDTAGLKFLANASLLLDPGDLKTCRLVCREWNKFIKDEVWGSSKGKKELTKKLADRWLSVDAMPVELRQVPKHGETYYREEHDSFTQLHHVKNIFCNNRNIFVGQSNGHCLLHQLRSCGGSPAAR